METILFAVSAGALSTFNPCAYTLLPAILSRFLEGQPGRFSALRLGLALTAGTLCVFAAIALLVATVGYSVGAAFPYFALAVAAVLLLVGTGIVAGRTVRLPLAPQLPDGATRTPFAGAFLYGLSFGAASLGCALPLLLTVAAVALAKGPLLAFGAISLYGLAMGTVLLCLCLATAFGYRLLLKRARPLGRLVQPLGAILLLAAAGYLIYLNVGYLFLDYRLGALLAWSASLLALVAGLAGRLLVTPRRSSSKALT